MSHKAQKFINEIARGSVVLLISDDPIGRYMLPMQLDHRGVITIDTHSIDNAVELLQMHTDIKLVLIDLPLIDSLEGVNAIREHRSFDDLPVVVLGEYEMHDHKLAALSSGASDFVVKSLNINSLIDALNEQLDQMQSQSADQLDETEVHYTAGQISLNQTASAKRP